MRHFGKRVIVTGGASGIGAAIAARFREEGAHVCVFDIDDKAPGFAIACDVSCPVSIRSALDQIEREWGSIDILCNNAGISVREPFEAISLDSWNRVLGVNLTGIFLMSQMALPLMKTGVMINIASVSGLVGMPNYLSYNVSKAGVIELTKTLALELAPKIRVNCICPGYILTPMQKKEYSPDAIIACAEKLPLKRLGKPEEIAALASYLASDEAAFATGQSFVIDGGETAGGMASYTETTTRIGYRTASKPRGSTKKKGPISAAI